MVQYVAIMVLGVQPNILAIRSKYTVGDLHPNDLGHEKNCKENR